MITKINKVLSVGLMCCGIAAALTACTDTWDDHYESLGSGNMHEGTLWQAIKSNPNLSNFAKVIEECDYAKNLNGSQVFTVFAPTNDSFSSEEAAALISEYKAQDAAKVTDEDNTVIKEFIQNHMALYNYSVSPASRDSIVLMNGKYAVLGGNNIDGVEVLTKNQLYGNGVLFTLKNKVEFLPNVFEYMRKDPDLDSLRSFFYNSHYYYKVFVPERSVAGSIVDGKTQYLDSVFTQRNELFSQINAQLNTEDSTYIFLAPTNATWKQLIEEYEPYFNYPPSYKDRDSMAYTQPRLAIINGTAFSRTFNTDATLPDSAMSESCIRNYTMRLASWGGLPFEYYEYRRPLDSPFGVLNQSADDIVPCSNGQVHKATQWNIDKLMSFHQWRIIQAEGRNSIKETSKVVDKGDSVSTIDINQRIVNSDMRNFYGRIWDNAFVEFTPAFSNVNHSVTFTLRNVLSNIGYDIYLVTVPALANDSNATAEQRVPTILRCTLKAPGRDAEVLGDTYTTKADSIDYLLLAEDYKFDYCTYGVDDEDLQVTLKVETRVSNAQQRNKQYTRTMRIDCILLVPHETLYVPEEVPYIWVMPHGVPSDNHPVGAWIIQR